MAGPGTGGGEHPGVDEQASEHDDDEEDEEDEDDDEEEAEDTEDSGGEETTDAALIEAGNWIAWQGYVPLKQVVWRGPDARDRHAR